MTQSVQQADRFESTREKLGQWAAWVMTGGGENLGVSDNILVAMIQTMKSSKSIICTISDDEALVIEGALARLKIKDPETARVTKAYFLQGQVNHRVAEWFGINRRRVTVLVESGVAWIDAVLNG